MQKFNLNALIEFDDERFRPKTLINEAGYRMVLLTMRAGQRIPEHAAQGRVMVQAILGHVTFFAGGFPDELYAGEVICVDGGVPHSIEANEDSALFVLTASDTSSSTGRHELDLCQVPRPERHSLVFERFDALAVGDSFVLINDHNPVILDREFENTRPGQAIWERLNRGPEKYRVRIRRVAPPRTADTLVVVRPDALLHEIHDR